VDLNITGEMSVANPTLVGGGLPRLIFPTLIPETASSCGFGGTSWILTLNPRNGGQFGQAIFDLNGDGAFDGSDLIGGTTPPAGINPGIGIIPEPVIIRDPANQKIILGYPSSQGSVGTSSQKDPKSSGRQGWRQLR
jgi:type IV pilus assembly protein PilY1